MEIRRLLICLAFFLLAVISQCSEARHALTRRASDYDASNEMLNDDSNDYGTQNDADGGDDEEEPEVTGVITSKGQQYRLPIGRSVRLDCQVSPKEGTVASWTKDDTQLFIGKHKVISSPRFSLSGDSSDMLIKDLEINDTGSYTCYLEQKNRVAITHTIIVEEPPRVTKFSATDNGYLREGSNLLLTCETSGTPKPSTIWSRQRNDGMGTERLSEANGQFSEKTFYKKNVSKEDAGTYYCYAVSDAGNATAMLTVTVIGKPRVHVHRAVINTDIGVEAELLCSVHDESTPHIRWYKDEQLIEDVALQYTIKVNGSESTLIVTPKVDEDFGTFTCEAENAHGKHNKSIDLVQSPVIEKLDVNGPKLTWTVHSHQPLEDIEVLLKAFGEEGQWSSFKVPLPDSKAHEYELIYVIDEKSVDPGTYEATVRVKNNKSWSHANNAAVVKLDNQAQLSRMQTASVFGRSGNGAQEIQPMATVLLSSALMYLLVRML